MANSYTAPYAFQRTAENVSALAGELVDRDRQQREALAELERSLAHSLPVRELVHYQRKLLSKVVILQKADDLTDDELRRYARPLAGFAEALSRQAKEKALSPATEKAPERKGAHGKDTTNDAQLALFGEHVA